MPWSYPIIIEYISNCQLKKKSSIHKIKAKRVHVYTNKTNYPLALLYLDHYCKLPATEDGNEYILTARDNFTRYVWFLPFKDTKATTVIKELEDNIFKYF